MSFCGTLALQRRMKINNLYFEAFGMASTLLDLVIDKPQPDSQYPLFKLNQKHCQDFERMAKTLRWFKRLKTGEPVLKGEHFWKAYDELEYGGSDFFPIFQFFDDETLEKHAVEMEKLSKNELLEDYQPLMDFLRSLGNRAHAHYENGQGGCF